MTHTTVTFEDELKKGKDKPETLTDTGDDGDFEETSEE
jgi:hypothetical protein